MPELKHNFVQGRMNKDLDERIVPNGEYRDATNIQVSSSEDSDVGTIQNILGNVLVDSKIFTLRTRRVLPLLQMKKIIKYIFLYKENIKILLITL